MRLAARLLVDRVASRGVFVAPSALHLCRSSIAVESSTVTVPHRRHASTVPQCQPVQLPPVVRRREFLSNFPSISRSLFVRRVYVILIL